MASNTEQLTERQIERLKNQFRDGLAKGMGEEGARNDVRSLLQDFLQLDYQSAYSLAQQIANKALDQAASIRTIDSMAIVRPSSAQEPWYLGPQENDQLWPNLKDRLLREKGWSHSSVQSIDECSNTIVGRLGAPGLTDSKVRGLVVGHVQSGKTANMTAVIAKAVDRGYRLVLILAGMTDSLRTQTQRRLEDDLVRGNAGQWDLLTFDEQDFQAGSRPHLSLPETGAVLAVIKKETNILRRFREFLERTPGALKARAAALVIDDETDQASPDVSHRYRDPDPSTINRRIREVLEHFGNYSYVGYTATPFANVLADPSDQGEKGRISPGLYPEDFIVALPTPPDYFGPEALFGRDMTAVEDDMPEGLSVDMIRAISPKDMEAIRTLEGSSLDGASRMPASLEDAVLWYLMAASVMQIRKPAHSTMLVHTSSLTDAHDGIAEALKWYVSKLKAGESQSLLRRMKSVYDEELGLVRPEDFNNHQVPFDEVSEKVLDILSRLQVWRDNYVSDDRVEFPDGGEPVFAIIVGGNRLARGVTLPGLLVSYFARNSKQYDTLLQMGRWFGYRHGYEDLPRIYMSGSTAANFRELATIEAEVREDISVYANGNISPRDWAVRIRQVPGMLVTRPAALQYSRTAALSYGGEHIQTIRFYHRDKSWLTANWAAGSELIDRAQETVGHPTDIATAYVYHRLPVELILQFLQEYQTTREQRRMNLDAISKYINEYMNAGLSEWNLGIITPKNGQLSDLSLGVLDQVRTNERSRMKSAPYYVADIKALMSRRDVLVDVNPNSGRRPVIDNKLGSGWKSVKDHRRQVQGAEHRPLMLLYPIRKDSRPKAEGGDRVSLDAVSDILGLGMVFPEGRQGDFISVDLSHLEIEEEAESGGHDE